MSDVKRVLIVGCGIGGAMAAHTLTRIGIAVHCVDAAPRRSTAGTGICLLHNTLRALCQVGLEDACMAQGQRFDHFRQFDAAGNQVAHNPTALGLGITRPDLAQILENSAISAGAQIDFGTTVTSLQDLGEQVSVGFSDGRSGQYDLVVGADGVHSQIRREVFGSGFDAEFVGQSCWRFNAPRLPEHDGFWLFRNGRSVVGAIPTCKQGCYLFVLEESEQPLHFPTDALVQLLQQRLAGFTAPLIVQAAAQLRAPEQVIFRPFHARLMPGPWWHRGRVVLLGDAAHAPTPQLTSGGGLAIEDAVVLAETLATSATATDALQAYSQRRIPRVTQIWQASKQISEWEHDDPFGNRERSAALLLASYQLLGEPI